MPKAKRSVAHSSKKKVNVEKPVDSTVVAVNKRKRNEAPERALKLLPLKRGTNTKELGRGRGAKASSVAEDSDDDIFDSDEGHTPDEEDNDLDDSDRSSAVGATVIETKGAKEVRPPSKPLSSTPIVSSKPISATPVAILSQISRGIFNFYVFNLPNPCFSLAIFMFKH